MQVDQLVKFEPVKTTFVKIAFDKLVFDTIYHEHVSHHALVPLEKFFNSLDMTLFSVQRVQTKGGSIRAFAQPLSTGKRPKENLMLIHKVLFRV